MRPSSGELECVYSLWYKAPLNLPAGDQDEVGTLGCNYHPKHVELIETVIKIITAASSWLFILFISTIELLFKPNFVHMNTFFVTADFKDMCVLSAPFVQNYRPDLTNVLLLNFPTRIEKSLNFWSQSDL